MLNLENKRKITFGVVSPTYSEAKNLKWLISEILNSHTGACVVVVNDFSGGKTESVINELQPYTVQEGYIL